MPYAVSDSDESAYSDAGSDVPVQKIVKGAKGAKAAPKAARAPARPVEEVYQKKTQLEHILLRPDTYIGSVERHTQAMWVLDHGRMVQRTLSFVPGLFKIFDEILVNAADNKSRDPAGMDTLRVDIDRASGRVSVFNNGRGIPVEMHGVEKLWVPEMIFGHLLTSSNYDDSEKKVTGGRNGYGAKLCNIFSTEFTVETADRRRRYAQTFRRNMTERTEPAIAPCAEEYTRITFFPDLAKFGMSELDDDIVALFERRVYDLAGCVAGVRVFLNGERVPVRTFKQYVELFQLSQGDEQAAEAAAAAALSQGEDVGSQLSLPKPRSSIVHERVNERWEVCVAPSDGQFAQMSFVNSICTSKGGTHVAHVADQLVAAVIEALKKPKSGAGKELAASLKPFHVRNHMALFVNCLIENPSFDSQTKENMTLRPSSFGSECKLSDDFVRRVLKCGIVDGILHAARARQDQQLRKTDGAKRARLSGITKLDDANNAGTKAAAACTLILTEGDSAKALAVSGLSVVGRDNYGVFPLRGKLLNVREATHKQIMENAEINHIKQIMGLQHGRTYTSVDTLRYGRLMIMADQDHDGSHIKGLLINFLDHFFPSLLRVPGFLVEFVTPIVRATRGREDVAFYSLPEYDAWRERNDGGRGWTIKYYKGLGTSTAADAKRYFAAMDRHRKAFTPATDADRAAVDMAFNKRRADERKDWLKAAVAGTHVDHAADSLSISDFINKELILFSMADNVRSIPSVVDGLKPGHRKILFACFKRRLRAEIKVAQLAGYVAEHSAYHHGEQSLCATIVGMAQNYAGANNAELLVPSGQFGTRLQGGKDAASPRYIFTMLSPFARALFREEDDALLKYLSDDGQRIEPEWYVPILPLVLVNGGEGIGTGWMTSIPSFNPRDVVANLRALMDGRPAAPMHPWYRGFRGTIEPLGDGQAGRYRVLGRWRLRDRGATLEVTELPVGTWTQAYKEFLEGLVASGAVRDYKEHHTDTSVHFVVSLPAPAAETPLAVAEPADLDPSAVEAVEKKFRLASLISLANMVCFDPQGRIRRYESPLAILDEFFHMRLAFYARRKDHLAEALGRDWRRADARMRFVLDIVEGRLAVHNRRRADIVADLRGASYPEFSSSSEGESEESSGTETGGYDYLLNMPIHSLTREKVERLRAERAEKEAALGALLAQTPRDLWRADLDAFEALWDAELAAYDRIVDGASGSAAGGPKAGRKRAKKAASDDDSAESAGEVYAQAAKARPRPRKAQSQPLVAEAPAADATSAGVLSAAHASQPIGSTSVRASFAKSTGKAKPSASQPLSAAPGPVAGGQAKAAPPVPQPAVPQLSAEEVAALPLAERINYMLAQRSAASSAPAVPTQSVTAAPKKTPAPRPKKEGASQPKKEGASRPKKAAPTQTTIEQAFAAARRPRAPALDSDEDIMAPCHASDDDDITDGKRAAAPAASARPSRAAAAVRRAVVVDSESAPSESDDAYELESDSE